MDGRTPENGTITRMDPIGTGISTPIGRGDLEHLRGRVSAVQTLCRVFQCLECPQKDSNLRTWLRRPVLYPLSYGGSLTEKGYQSTAVGVTRVP